MRHPNELLSSFKARLVRLPILVRVLVIAWLVAGVGYFLISSIQAVIPLAMAIAIVLPFLISVALFTLWNFYRAIYWVAGKARP